MQRIKIAILGASGYTGAELVRLLAAHPAADIRALTANRQAGKPLGAVFPHLARCGLPDLATADEVDYSDIDLVFCALPHGTTQGVIAALPEHLRIIDLSADFRLARIETYAEWYGHAHQAPDLQAGAVYGLSELARDDIRTARLVANPGCYPTAAQLPLIPPLRDGLIAPEGIIIDAKSGVSGAGRDAKQGTLFAEVTEGIHPYGVASHRHAPEIEQGLSGAAGTGVTVSFTPHLMPMSRGILATTYVTMTGGNDADGLRASLQRAYGHAPFVHILEPGIMPATRHVRGSNHCLIQIVPDRVPGRAIILSVIDNLVKGASGQAIQNMNIMFDFSENTGLQQEALFP